jgi:hypothetical protein
MTDLFTFTLWMVSAGCVASPAHDLDRSVAAVQRFERQMQSYVSARREVVPSPLLSGVARPAEVWKARMQGAAKLRAVRASARDGNLFSPEVAAMFRGRIADALTGRDIDRWLSDQKDDDDPPSDPEVHANEMFPEGRSHLFPVSLLSCLPALPAAVEYRLVGRSLVIVDVDLEVIVDVLPRAFAVLATDPL